MIMDELIYTSARALAQSIRQKKGSSEEVVSATLRELK
jgi:hypothetical protein